MKKHQKHAKITRPNYGNFARNEWAIIGTPCGDIQKLSFQLINALSSDWKVGYADADHQSADEANKTKTDDALGNGAFMEYTDKISHHRFDTNAKLDIWQHRQQFNEVDVCIVNGNHFKAKARLW